MNISNSNGAARIAQSLFDTQRSVAKEQQVSTDELTKTKESIVSKTADSLETANKVREQRTDTNKELGKKIDVFV